MARRSAGTAAAVAADPAVSSVSGGIDWANPVTALKSLSAAFRKEITGAGKSIVAIAKEYGAMREKVVVVAPRLFAPMTVATDQGFKGGLFVRLNNTYGCSLADFARLLDSTVPAHARSTDPSKPKGYLFHPTYAAIAYMKRTYAQTGKAKGQRGKMDLATNLEVRALATLIQLAASPESFWATLQSELMLTPERTATLQKRVAQVKPLFRIHVKPQALAVDHMESGKVTAAAADNKALGSKLRRSLAAVTLGQPGKRVRRAS